VQSGQIALQDFSNLELESAFSEIVSLRSTHDDTSAKPCDNCTRIMINYANMWLFHSRLASLLDGVRLKLRELKARSTLLGVCTTCHLFRSDLEASTIEIKNLKHKIDHSSHYSVLFPPCDTCGSLKVKLFHAIKENIELHQKIAYLTACLQKTALSEKMIENDLSKIEESATKSTNKLGVSFERCENKGESSAPKFVPSFNYHKEEQALKPTKTNYTSNPKSSFNPKREVRKETPSREMKSLFACFVAVQDTWMSFASGARGLRSGALIMPETHIVMSFLIFHLTLPLVFCLALLLVFCLSSLMNLTIAHMV
jgi:hypothetical protein